MLDDIEGIDLYELLQEHWHNYINTFDQEWNPKEANEPRRSFKITEITDVQGEPIPQIKYRVNLRSITGKISTGSYGQGGDIIDEEKNVVFNLQPTHAIPKPFFFLICIPEHSQVGYFITEKDGIHGISQIFHLLLKNCLKSHLPEKTFAVDNFIEDCIIRNHINHGIYNEITFTTIRLPRNTEEQYGITHYENNEYTIELKIKAKNKQQGITGNLKQRIINKFRGIDNNILDFTQGFNEIGIDDTSIITVDSLHNGSSRKIQLDNPTRLRSVYKISVSLDSDGHSNFQSIENESINLLNSFGLNIFAHGN